MYCTKEQLKDDLHHYLSGFPPGDIRMPEDAPYMDPDAEKVLAGFESVDFDMDAYIKNRVYESLGYKKAYDVLSCVCLIHVPTLEDLMTDWYNGYQDLTTWSHDGKWNIHHKLTRLVNNELLRQLYFCDTYESFWLFVNKHGNIEALYKWYQGISPDPEFEKLQGIPCYCKPNPELVKRFEAFFDIQPEQKQMVYTIEGEEVDRYMAFRKAHLHKGTGGKMGDSVEITFYSTGVGRVAEVKCLECGGAEILTDLDSL